MEQPTQFLQLSTESSEPFIIPNVSPYQVRNYLLNQQQMNKKKKEILVVNYQNGYDDEYFETISCNF